MRARPRPSTRPPPHVADPWDKQEAPPRAGRPEAAAGGLTPRPNLLAGLWLDGTNGTEGSTQPSREARRRSLAPEGALSRGTDRRPSLRASSEGAAAGRDSGRLQSAPDAGRPSEPSPAGA